jgi:predicted phosphodiesterase
MKILIFSDTHLYNKFDVKQYRFLKKIISKADKVIINGDFWDSYRTNFDQFIKSKWRGLFPILKQKNTIYLYGNHDPVDKINDKWSLFADEFKQKHIIKINKKNIIIEHGNNQVYAIDERINFLKHFRFIGLFIMKLEELGIKNIGYNFSDLWFYRKKQNINVQKFVNKHHKNDLMVCGHIHKWYQSKNYINLGYISYGHASYVVIDNNNINLIKEKY